jgi:glycosyltransferase involved in cell wall biosynthesis
MKVCLWLLLPTHYHRAFAREVANRCDLQVVYFNRFTADRIALGWQENAELAPYEHWESSLPKLTAAIQDWKDRVHVIPNYGEPFTRLLVRFLTQNGAEWADWSESSRPGWRWLARSPWKAWWTFVVRRHALGSFYAGLRAERDFVLRGLKRSRTAFLPWVCDPPSMHPVDEVSADFNRGRNAFVYLGAFSHRKATDVLLKAAAMAFSTKPNWSLILVGNDQKNGRYRKLANSLNLNDKVLFRGAVRPDLIGTILAACKVLILPSRYDGWGLALNEGLLSGLALISSHMCGAGDHLVISGKNGFRFQAGSKKQLAEVMQIYIRNPGLAEDHGAASRLMSNVVDAGVNAEVMLSTLRAWRGARHSGDHFD